MRLLLSLLCIFSFQYCQSNETPAKKHLVKETPTAEAIAENKQAIEWLRFQTSIDSLCKVVPAYLIQKQFNTTQIIVAHLGIHSGLPRMALVNVTTKTLADSGCVAHGCGSEAFAEKAVFSNVPNSLCSSLGRYKIGAKYNGNFGAAYKLRGLDKTNSKAFERFVVLHAYSCVPDTPPYPDLICNSQGCPMVSYEFLGRLSKVIDQSAKPMLLVVLQ